jgi:group I intron endonuclease
MIGIYKITNPKGKVYIGQTINYDRRKKEYVRQKGKGQPLLNKSMLEYTSERHLFEIIEECKLEQLDEKEKHWKEHYIDLLGWEDVLFCHIIDGKGGFKSLKTKIKMSNYSKNRPKEHNHNISKALTGYKQSKQHIANRSKSMKGVKIPGKYVNQYDLQGNFIQEWKNARQACIFYNPKDLNGVSACCLGRQKTAFGFIWKYK